MFNKEKFSIILNSIYKTFDNQRSFADATGVNRGYLSQYINKKLDNPPTPKILEKIANASKGLATYDELMLICGYASLATKLNSPMVNNDIAVLILFISENEKLIPYNDLWVEKKILQPHIQYFAYKTNDESMSPLLGIGDIAIIEQTNTYENEQTYLFTLDNNILIRKLVDFNTHIELQPINYHFDTIKLTKEEMHKRNFKILGEVVEAKNQSAFKKKRKEK